jgi:hypothetical protein
MLEAYGFLLYIKFKLNKIRALNFFKFDFMTFMNSQIIQLNDLFIFLPNSPLDHLSFMYITSIVLHFPPLTYLEQGR